MLPEEFCVPMLRFLISSATTANPLPASPALAASMEAFKAKRLVWEVMLSIVPVSCFTISNWLRNSPRIFSTSADNCAMTLVDSTTFSSSAELVEACSDDSLINATMRSVSSDTFAT